MMNDLAQSPHAVIVYPEDQYALALDIWRSLRSVGLSAGLFDESIAEVDTTHLIVICSKASKDSLTLAEAIRTFDQNHDRDNIITIRYGGEETPLPPVLMTIVGQDKYLIPCEPKTVFDLSGSNSDAISWLTDRIVSQLNSQSPPRAATGIKGKVLKPVPLTAIAASLVLGLASVWSLNSIQTLEAQRDKAEHFSTILLTELTEELPTNVRSDILIGISDELISSFNSDDLSRLESAEIQRRAQLYHFLGEAYDTRSQNLEAVASFHKAYEMTQYLAQRSSSEESSLYAHALSAFWIANSAWRSGNLELAAPYYEEFGELINQLVEVNPESSLYRAEQGHASINNGIIALENGNFGYATDLFQRAIDIFGSGLIESGDINLADIAGAHAWLADAYEQQGSLVNAVLEREREAQYRNALHVERPDSLTIRYEYAHSLHEQAVLKGQIGQIDEAQMLLEEGLRLIASAAEGDRSNTRYRRLYTSMLRARAKQSLWRGNLYAAQLVLDEARRVQSIWDEAGQDDHRHITQASIHLIAGEIAYRSGAYESARNESLEALLDGQLALDTGVTSAERYIAEAHLLRGEILQQLGEFGEAGTSYRSALTFYERDTTPSTPKNLDALARIEWRIGNLDEAQRIRSVLEAQDYQRPDFIEFWQQAQADVSAQSTLENLNNGG